MQSEIKMNKLKLLAGAALLCAASASAQDKPFSIHGYVNGNEGKYIYLYRYCMDGNMTADSTLVKNSQFTFNGTSGENDSFGMLSLNPKKIMSYDENSASVSTKGDITVALDVYDMQHPRIYGDPEIYQSDEYEGLVRDEANVMGAIRRMTRQSNDSAYVAQLEKLSDEVNKSYDKKTISYIKSHPNSTYSAQLLKVQMGDMTLEDTKAVYNCLSDEVKQSDGAKEIAEEIATREKIEPGKAAPDFTATDINGKKFTFSKLKGHYVVLDFWASWCKPCRASNPHMKELYEKYGKKGLEFVYVSDDDSNPQKWRDAVKKDGLEPFHHVLRGLKIVDPKTYKYDRTNDISEKYAVHYLPTKYLIDKDGKMVGKFESEELTAKLEEIFGF